MPLNILPSVKSCDQPQCQVNVNALCPALLRTGLDQNGVNYGCIAACNAGFGAEKFGNRACCTGTFSGTVFGEDVLIRGCGYRRL